MDYRTIVVRFRLRIINEKEIFQALQVHGFPKELKEEVLQILWEDRRAFLLNSKKGDEKTVQKIENLLRNWQLQKKRKKGKNVYLPKT